MVRDGKGALDAMASPDPSVSAAYYYVCSQYHKAKQEFAEFYRHGMLYLAFVSSESLPEATRRDLAADHALAARLAEDVAHHQSIEDAVRMIGYQYQWPFTRYRRQ